jgi:DivIVA domain-containing protein
MDVTPQELRGSEIKEAWRGYNRDEVDELLERAAVTIEGLSQQLSTAGATRAPAPAVAAATDPGSLQMSRDDAEMLQRTLLLAQRAADDAVNEAQAQARRLIEESEARAQSLVGEAEATARRIAESERRRLEAEIQDLAGRRDTLQADADALEAYASSYRERVRAAIEADLDRLGSGTIEPPMPRPGVSDVEVPPAPPAVPVAEHVPDPEPERGGSNGEFGADTRAITVDAPSAAAAYAAEVAPSPVAAPPRPTEPEWPPAAPVAPPPEASAAAAPGGAAPGAPSGSWLAANDDWSPADPAFREPAPWDQPTAMHEPFASEVPMEATAVEADALDDDAFFASLRDAVREEQPLGPRDDDASGFYDDDLTGDDRRRFRRRR